MSVSYLRPIQKTEVRPETVQKPPKLNWQIITVTIVAVVIFYFTAIGFWTVVAPLINHH